MQGAFANARTFAEQITTWLAPTKHGPRRS
jgi:hypothetical protein